MKMKKSMVVAALVALLAPCLPAFSQPADVPPITVWFRDDAGRHFIPRGFVVVTEEHATNYSLDDYRRMVRLGANFQVIRISLGPLGGWPGNEMQQEYLERLDRLVGYGKEMGLKTCFKLTVYFTKGFDWTTLWKNKRNEQDYVAKAWRTIWERYKDEDSVFGYDLLNEPFKGKLPDYRACEKENLVPLYRRLIDELRTIDSKKWALVQPLLRNKEDRPQHDIPFVEFKTPIEREGVAYAPHTYEGKPANLEPTFDRYAKEAALLNAPLMIGEWGPATFERMDKSWAAQTKFQNIYFATTELFDRRGLGGVKAWFTGLKKMHTSDRGTFTFSQFRDPVAVGTAERKYVMDFVARPGPLAVAGRIKRYGFDFASRTFSMELQVDRDLGASTIFVGADRHYPDGFSVLLNDAVAGVSDPLKGGGLESPDGSFSWDAMTQRLTISRWPGTGKTATLKIIPGTTGLEQVYKE